MELCALQQGGVWEVCGEQSWGEAERRPTSAGPARQAMEAPFAVVAGSQWPGEEAAAGAGAGTTGDGMDAAALLELAVFIANLFVLTSDASPAVILDADAGDGAVALDGPTNLLLVGGPRHNAVTARLAAHWRRVGHAALWSDDGSVLSIGGCEYDGASVGAVVLGPRPGGGLALVLHGTDLRGLRDAVALGEPTIPPMARSPWTNLVPDFAVTGPRFAAEGYGGLLAAGFFGVEWGYVNASSYSQLCM